MTRWCLLAAVAVTLLSRSVPVQPAQAENRVRTKDGTFSQKLRGTDVRPEVATPVGKARDLTSPEMADEERAHGGKTTQGRNRRSVTQSRSTSSLFSQQLGTGSKLLLTVSLLAGGALVLGRVGGALWKCLAGVGGPEPRDGSTPRSLSSFPSSDACERLFGQIAENYGGEDVASESRSSSLARRASAGTSNLMLVAIVLFSIIAIAVAGPPTTAYTEAEEAGMLVEGSGEEEDYGSDEVEEIDDTPPPVEVKGNDVTIGKGWETQDGVSKQGEAIFFDYGGKHYTVYLSVGMEAALNREEQQAVISALKEGPTTTQEDSDLYVWGKNTPGSILAYDLELTLGEQDVAVEVYLPGGVFGLSDDNDRLNTETDIEGYFDLFELVHALMHVIVTGQEPSLLEE